MQRIKRYILLLLIIISIAANISMIANINTNKNYIISEEEPKFLSIDEINLVNLNFYEKFDKGGDTV
ncbi:MULTISPECIES: hypothetical protein [Caloramator]|uniref:Uncharacterized protein n=1 Tax=Caloramator australicus RC3 TaxID=857293 RepID=I7K7Y6_9CLOT|nr:MULTISPECIES: hypothetical protein [Caloramator]MDO6354004.1 hypothetical protein [Caloramator sp. CAR-1]WDU83675.1 hypothetical protein PWK10_03550 [Caloramator sp. Dgby_cultured_2]CCJ33649.1 hypothetical protein CAAU_1565 [Caloramator australicus RC3]